MLCPCLHRHQPSAPTYPLRPVRVPSDPTRFIPSTAPLLQRDLHAPGALGNLTAQHPRGNPWVAEVPSPLWGLALGRGPKGGVLLRPFPTAGPGIPRGHRAEGHTPGGHRRGERMSTSAPRAMPSGNLLLSFDCLTQGALSPGNFPVMHPTACPTCAPFNLCGQPVLCGCAPFCSLSVSGRFVLYFLKLRRKQHFWLILRTISRPQHGAHRVCQPFPLSVDAFWFPTFQAKCQVPRD